MVAIEVKVAASLPGRAHRSLSWLRDTLGDRFISGIVLHLGEHAVPLGDRLVAAPISALWS